MAKQVAAGFALAHDPELSNKKLARALDVSLPTIARWKEDPGFQRRVANHVKLRIGIPLQSMAEILPLLEACYRPAKSSLTLVDLEGMTGDAAADAIADLEEIGGLTCPSRKQFQSSKRN